MKSVSIFCLAVAAAAHAAASFVFEGPTVTNVAGRDGWRETAMTDIVVRAGSALDLSGLPGCAPAGAKGWAKPWADGSLRFEGAPDEKVRLYGCVEVFLEFKRMFDDCTSREDRHARIDEFVAQTRRMGFNFIRPHGMLDAGYDIARFHRRARPIPEEIDTVDYLLHACRKAGVYVYIDIAAYGLRDPKMHNQIWQKAGVMVKEPTYWALWENCCREILGHVNPYTGLAWKDDPAVMGLMQYNEQATGAKIAMQNAWKGLDPKVKAAYVDGFRAWLAQNAPDVPQDGIAATAEKLPGFYGKDPLGKLLHAYLSELFTSRALDYNAVARSTGFGGILSSYNSDVDYGACAARWRASEAVPYNFHAGHPQGGGSGYAGAVVSQRSTIEAMASGSSFCYGNRIRLADRPYIVTENSHAFWNRLRHESALMLPAYGALNGYSGILWHAGGGNTKAHGNWPRGCITVFGISTSPITRATTFLGALLFRRGDVAEARRSVNVAVPEAYWREHSASAPSTTQARLGLMVKYGLVFPEGERPASVTAPLKADITITPGSGDEVEDGLWVSKVREKESKDFDLDAFVAKLKARGILPKDNVSSPKDGVYQSETGEITLRGRERDLSVVTPRTEAVCTPAGRSQRLGVFTLDGSSEDCCAALASIDGEPLFKSRRMVFLWITQESNSGMITSADGKTMVRMGGYPALLKGGRVSFRARVADPERFKMHLLDYSGARLEEVPVRVENGELACALDTSRLSHGPTPFFELVADAAGATCRSPENGGEAIGRVNVLAQKPAKTFPGKGTELLTDGRINPACTIEWEGKPVFVEVDFGRSRTVGGVRIVAARSWVNCGVRKASFYSNDGGESWRALKEHVAFGPANTYGEVWTEWPATACRKVRMVVEETWDRQGNYYNVYTLSASYDIGRMFGGPVRDIWGDGAWGEEANEDGRVSTAKWQGGKTTVQIAEMSFWEGARPDDLPRVNRPDEAYPAARLLRDWAYQACAPSGNVSLVANVTADTARPDALGTDISQVQVDVDACRRRRIAFLEPFRAKFRQFVYVKHHVIGNSIVHATDDLTDWTFKEWRNIPEYGGKSQLCLATLNEDGTVSHEVLVDRPDGVVRDPTLSADARRVVFSMRNDMVHDNYHLYELDLGTRALRQLTFDAEHDGQVYPCSDIEPCFVPDGSLVFQSTRCSHSIDCWPLPVSNLYRCDADGRNIRRLGFDQVNTFYPQLLDDGRVLYSRWEYNDRTSGFALGLMVMNPDGSRQTGFALCNSAVPTSAMHARGIPGTGNAMFVDVGHHCGQKGHLAEVDPAIAGDYDGWTYSEERACWGLTKVPTTRARYRGKTNVKVANWPYGANPAAVAPTLKGVFSLAGSATSGAAGRVPYPMPRLYKYPAIETGYSQTGPQWAYPFPLGGGRFLVSFMPEGDRFQRGPFSSRLGIYAMDETGRRELLAFDWLQHAMQPVPVMPRRTTPRKLAPIDWRDGFGTFYVQNVYSGAAMEGAPAGCVKKLRVVAISYRAAHIGWNGQYYSRMVTTDGKIGTPVSAGNGSYDIKHVLGEADVESDGSCSVRVPARTPVYFQLIDGNGCAVQTMRSWATLQPGEVNGCIGCHERPGTAAAANAPAMALRRAPQRLKAFAPGKEHPVLDLLEREGPLASIRNFMGVNWMEEADGKSNNGAFSFTRNVQPILDRKCISCHDGSRPEPPLDKLGGIPAKATCFDLRAVPGEIPPSDDNSHRAYTRSYLNLSCRGFDNDKINFAHGLSHVPFHPPYSFGSATSDYYRMLVAGHPDASGRPRVALDEDEKKILATWIDLCVPFAGAYTEANTWSEEHRRRYFWFQNKRVFFAWGELNDIRKSIGLSAVPLAGIVPGVTPPKVQRHWAE